MSDEHLMGERVPSPDRAWSDSSCVAHTYSKGPDTVKPEVYLPK